MRARRFAFADSSLRAFSAHAEGRIEFLADLGSLGGQQLVRRDQVALDVQWKAPGNALQTIVGRRYSKRYPTRIRYHIDHLSLVLDNFDDRIRIGEGTEVRSVLHPAAFRASSWYQYRLTDSLGVEVLGQMITVYRLQVRPRCPADPGVVGTLYIDRNTRAIARMSVTFTPASYVDPRIDYVNVDLESGYIGRRVWLPVEQRIEIRRQVNWLDLPMGGIIRTSFRVSGYDLDPRISADLKPGKRVATLPASELQRYVGWEEPLDSPAENGEPPDSARFAELRRQAIRIAAGRYLGAGGALRAYVPDLSSFMRARRAEGFLLGAGTSFRLDDGSKVFGWVGYPFGRQRPEFRLGYGRSIGPSRFRLTGYLSQPADIGPFSAAAGVESSLGLALRGDDLLDPYFRDGITAALTTPLAGGSVTGAISFEDDEIARLEGGPIGSLTPRAVRRIQEGDLFRITARFERALGRALSAEWHARIEAEVAPQGPGDFGYSRWLLRVRGGTPVVDVPWRWSLYAAAGVESGTPPAQRLFLLGGRGSVPGYRYRGWGGDRIAVLSVRAAHSVWGPWVEIQSVAAVGWSDLSSVGRPGAAVLEASGTQGLRPSLGGGVGLLYNLLQVQLARGLDDGRWEWAVQLNRSLRAPL